LLNTVFAGATTAYLTDNLTNPADMPQVLPLAFIHGYHVAFWWGAGLYLVSFLIAVFIINATVRDLPSDPTAVGNT
jgi:hypothetical protein